MEKGAGLFLCKKTVAVSGGSVAINEMTGYAYLSGLRYAVVLK
jgi:sensor histidine kinase regulating citrate/malate metabolism